MTECKWKLTDMEFDDYQTSCGQIQCFEVGTPEHNEFKYCPYCGGLLIDITEDKS